MSGTSGLFVFSIIFLLTETVIIYAYDNNNIIDSFMKDAQILDIQPITEPTVGTPWYSGGAIVDVGKGLWYIGGTLIYIFSQIINIIAFPFMIAVKVIAFSSKYPIILIVNSFVIVISAYSVLSRVMGGD